MAESKRSVYFVLKELLDNEGEYSKSFDHDDANYREGIYKMLREFVRYNKLAQYIAKARENYYTLKSNNPKRDFGEVMRIIATKISKVRQLCRDVVYTAAHYLINAHPNNGYERQYNDLCKLFDIYKNEWCGLVYIICWSENYLPEDLFDDVPKYVDVIRRKSKKLLGLADYTELRRYSYGDIYPAINNRGHVDLETDVPYLLAHE